MRHLVVLTALAALLVASVLAGCTSSPTTRVVAEGRTLTLAEAAALLDDSDIGSMASRPVEEAESLRRAALGSMRSRGGSEADLAALLTDTFAPQSRAVPILAELASVDGTEAWIVIEAWGPPQGTLDMKRLWVLDASDGTVIFSSTSR